MQHCWKHLKSQFMIFLKQNMTTVAMLMKNLNCPTTMMKVEKALLKCVKLAMPGQSYFVWFILRCHFINKLYDISKYMCENDIIA